MVLRLTVAADMYAFLKAFHVAFLSVEDAIKIHGRELDLYMYTDFLQLFDALTIGKKTEEKRLMMYILAARQSYQMFEIAGVAHIKEETHNPADGLAKLKHNGVLDDIFKNVRMVYPTEKWRDRRKANYH